MNTYLNNINTPNDLKVIPVEELPALAEEIRDTLIERVTFTGGHMGSNLGLVEATIALHYVFDSPKDKFVFDVSHQCYTHKILTGRKEAFMDQDKYYSVSGYTNPHESEHDFFTVGHTSTSISLAVGLAKARDLAGGKENIIAIIGDGSMSGGEAFEGLNNAAVLNSNMIILFNDNEMSIAPNQGGMYQNFDLLRQTKGEAECNFFQAFGFDYFYVDDGNDLNQLIQVFNQVKDTPHPTVIHIHTAKGKGLPWAEQDKEAGHWTIPGNFNSSDLEGAESYESITAEFMLKKIKKDSSVIAISPATPGANGLTPEFRKEAGKQYIDVGIAEEHAIAFASGIAKGGGKPVLIAFGSFLQRTYDQLMQDLALNGNAATILVFGTGLSGGDVTHSGAFDISMMSNIPGLVCLAPATKEEYLAMADWAIEQSEVPVIIRVPGTVISTGSSVEFDRTSLYNYHIIETGNKVAILGLGSFLTLGQQVKLLLKEKYGINATIINPRIYSSIDVNVLENLKLEHNIVVTLEDGILNGGFGEKVAGFYGTSDMKVLNFGGEKEFTDRIPLEKQYQQYHLTPELIVSDIAAFLSC